MINNIVVSAAGRGTRMGSLTTNQPKHLIQVAGRPFLTYLLDNIVAAGFTNIYVVIGYQATAAYDFLRQYKLPPAVKLKIINQFELLGEDRYGTLMPLVAVALELSGQSVVSVNGDNLYAVDDLKQMAQVISSAVAGQEHNNPQRYGVLVPRINDTLEKIVEKSSNPPSNFINVGLYAFGLSIWPILSQVVVSSRGEYELTDAVNILCAQEEVAIVKLTGGWLDFGRPEDIKVVEQMVKVGERRNQKPE